MVGAATIAKTTAAVTGKIIAAGGEIGVTVAKGTATIGEVVGTTTANIAITAGVENGTAVTVGTLSAGTTTTGLNLKVMEGAKDVAIVIGK
ncbi:hypothetical protein C7122_04530 [Lachnospiraceae bacterium oral taxon 096]|nr:hypothetical protein C7122_04530 [Lachnospiraceae bacterium oral taxon 096]